MSHSASGTRNDTFSECLTAAGDHQKHILLAHMWENGHADKSSLGAAGLNERKGEIDSVLGVMAGDAGTLYKDGRYLEDVAYKKKHGIAPGDMEFNARVMHGSKHGFIGLAGSVMSSRCQSNLMDYFSNTGLLLLDAKPVMVAPHDAWTIYLEKKEDKSSDRAWNYMSDYLKHYYTLDDKGMTADGRMFSIATDLAKDGAFKESLVGTLTSLFSFPKHPLRHIYEMQGKPEDVKRGFIQVDPLTPQTEQVARKAYTQMMDALQTDDTLSRYSEVDVNTNLEHVAGIVVYNSAGRRAEPNKAAIPGDPIIDPKKSWSEALGANPKLAVSLYRAFKEYDQLAAYMEKPEIKAKFPNLHVPTVVIYQPHAKDRMVHAEPTPQLRATVEGFLRQQGLLEKAGLERK